MPAKKYDPHNATQIDAIKNLRANRLSWGEVAQRLGLPKTSCYYLARAAGLDTGRKPIGCPDCKLKPYAKGYCHNCYTRHRRRLKKL